MSESRDLLQLQCPTCHRVALVLDFGAAYTALRKHPSVKLPPLPRSLLREGVLAQFAALAPFWSCGACGAPSTTQGV